MLLDPYKSKDFLYSKEGFLSWLEAQPPERTYNWRHTEKCLVGLYLNEKGEGFFGAHNYFGGQRCFYHQFFRSEAEYQYVGAGNFRGPPEWTFGRAQDRIRQHREWFPQ